MKKISLKQLFYIGSNASIFIFLALFLCFVFDASFASSWVEYRNLFVVIYLVLRLFYYQQIIKEKNKIIQDLKANKNV